MNNKELSEHEKFILSQMVNSDVKTIEEIGLMYQKQLAEMYQLNNIMELPKDEVVYGYISKQFPTTNVFFDSYETTLNSAMHDQPKHRPFYMIKATRHFEFCGIVEKGDKE